MVQVERISYKRIAGYTALVLGTLTILFVIYRLNQVILLFLLSVVVAAAMRKPMLAMQRRRIPRSAAILLLYALILVVLAGLIYFLGQSLGNEITTAGKQFPAFYDITITRWQASDVQWEQSIADLLPRTNQLVQSIGDRGSQVAYQVAGLTYGIANLAISLLAILTLTFYWLIDEDRFVRLWLMLLPVQQRMVARNTWQDIEARVGTFVRSESLQFVLTFVVLRYALGALSVPYPTVWALYAAIVQLIPWVGIPLTLLPALTMLIAGSAISIIAVVAVILITGIIMDRVIEPRLGVQGVVHPIVSVLALMIMGEAAGILGMVVALPLAATVQSILRQLVQINTAPKTSTQSVYSTQIQDLRARIARLQLQMPQDMERRLALEGMFRRVDGLLTETETEVQNRASAPEQRRMASKTEAERRIPAIFARNKPR